MDIQFKWDFPQFDAVPRVGDLTNVVKVIHWRRNATNGEYVASNYGTVTLGDPDPKHYTPYDAISEEWAVSLVVAGLAKMNQTVEPMDERLAREVTILATPPEERDTPTPMAPPFAAPPARARHL